MVKGSCMCGSVTYEIGGKLNGITHCHCTTCQKAHASAFSSVMAVMIEDFSFLSGEELIKPFESSPGKFRCFCSNCGSHIYAHKKGQKFYLLRMGTVDTDPAVRPVKHIFTSLKAPWYDLDTDSNLPRFDEWST